MQTTATANQRTKFSTTKDRNPFGGRGVTRHLMRSDTERVRNDNNA